MIPTAEEVWSENTGSSINQEEYSALIEFAKLHVMAALQAAAGEVRDEPWQVTKAAVLLAYPLTKII